MHRPTAIGLLSLLITLPVLSPSRSGFAAESSTPAAKEEPKRPLTAREQRALKNAPAKAPEPVVIDGVMRSAMGYPRVFAQIRSNGQLIQGRPATDLPQKVRAMQGDWMDLNLKASQGVQSWWTAILDTGADLYTVNDDVSLRFGMRPAGDFAFQSAVDGQDWKFMSGYYQLSLAGSKGLLGELPGSPFVAADAGARFTMEKSYYQPQFRLRPAGINVVGMGAIRNFTFEFDSSNAQPEELAKPVSTADSAAFEAALHNVVAGPTVTILPANFRPTNDVIRLPLRYLDAKLLNTARAGQTTSPSSIKAMAMGVRTTKGERKYVGNFVFDTGSPVTMISRWQAYQLGLIQHANQVYDKAEYESKLTGLANREVQASGFTLDVLEMVNPQGQVVQWRNVPVVVHDVVLRQYNDGYYILEGILGNNLLLNTTDGEVGAAGLQVAPAAFPKWWLHGPTGEIWLQRPATNSVVLR